MNKIEGGIRKVSALELADIADAIGVRMSSFFAEPVLAGIAHRSSQGLDTAESQIDDLLAKLSSDVEFVASLGAAELGLDRADALLEAELTQPRSAADAESLADQARSLMSIPTGAPMHGLTDSVAGTGLLAFSSDIGGHRRRRNLPASTRWRHVREQPYDGRSAATRPSP